jgi:HSP20 family protein
MLSSFFGGSRGGSLAPDWTPRLDLHNSKDGIVVKADLPGMKKEDIKLSVSGGVLSISGERSHEESKEEDGWKRLERSYGSFQRSVALPDDADESKVKADYKDGVLKVTIGKSEAAKAKAIQID